MSTYHKIQSVCLRDSSNNYKTFLENEWTTDAFRYLALNRWIFTEKVDGTNIRIYGDGGIHGRTDKAQIPPFLLHRLVEIASGIKDYFEEYFDGEDKEVILYGEGYGPKIQKGGGNYNDYVDFVLFDIRMEGNWLIRELVEDIANRLNIDTVPIIGEGTLLDAVAMCRYGFDSQWGDFEAEGIVARPDVELLDRRGNRVITKVKCKDFPKRT